jgi:hypothetical protein
MEDFVRHVLDRVVGTCLILHSLEASAILVWGEIGVFCF